MKTGKQIVCPMCLHKVALLKDQMDIIVAKFCNEDATMESLANEFHVSSAKIHDVLKKYNIQTTGPNRGKVIKETHTEYEEYKQN